jgi:sec-independent protein translocase protein TatB
MFDIGFSEIFVIAVVALIVIGPERLPRVARTLGHLFGRLQRYVAEVKADINREMELDELRKLQSTMQDAAREIEQGVSGQVQYVENEVKQAQEEAKQAVDSASESVSGAGLLKDAQLADAMPTPAEPADTKPPRDAGTAPAAESGPDPLQKQA